MAGRHPYPLVGLIGDDLTGVAAVAGEFAVAGLSCVLLVPGAKAAFEPEVAVLAISTESRHLPPAEAFAATAAAAATLRKAGARVIFKKVDSLLRGQVASELKAICKAFPDEAMIVAPAAPGNGRITRGGVQLHGGRPVSEEDDAGNQVRDRAGDAHIPTLLAAGIDRPIATLVAGEATPERLRELLAAGRPAPLIVCDAETSRDLAAIARIGIAAGIRLFAGTSELAVGIAESVAETELAGIDPVLLVVGSASAMAHAQLRELERQGLARLVRLPAVPGGGIEGCVEDALRQLREAPAVAIHAPPASGRVPAHAAEETARELADVAVRIMRRAVLSGVVATGGDTAIAVARAAGARGLRPRGTAGRGITESELLGGPHAGLAFITKPGSFGGEACLADLVRHLRHRSRAAFGPSSSARLTHGAA